MHSSTACQRSEWRNRFIPVTLSTSQLPGMVNKTNTAVQPKHFNYSKQGEHKQWEQKIILGCVLNYLSTEQNYSASMLMKDVDSPLIPVFAHASQVGPVLQGGRELEGVHQDEHQHSVHHYRHPEVLQHTPPPFIVHLNTQSVEKTQVFN